MKKRTLSLSASSPFTFVLMTGVVTYGGRRRRGRWFSMSHRLRASRWIRQDRSWRRIGLATY